ncbi:hypothetical protein DK419_26805 [Methylobacterium terrae]|uniref:Uncharacterized protein n=1 Tax=Methylobacterium terrae TaxID=2202827 RepID=A0A2U8WW39_9HYPH|nr:hypothetical protein DK419_26805 [Methylobacterium terrae]
MAAGLVAGLVAVSTAAQARGGGGHSGHGGYGTGYSSHSHSVSGYTNSHGTYVAPHHATNPNSTKLDNYSTHGNVNPYTGAVGTKSPY